MQATCGLSAYMQATCRYCAAVCLPSLACLQASPSSHINLLRARITIRALVCRATFVALEGSPAMRSGSG